MASATMNRNAFKETLPAISIIIITLNEEKVLPVLLQELEKQSYQNFQLIILDSNSSDSTQQVAQKYTHLGESFIFHNCGVTKGPGYGRNQGVLLAEHEILLFLDADNTFPNIYFLEDTVGYLTDNELDVAGCFVKAKSRNISYKIGCWIANVFMRCCSRKFPIVPGGYILSKKKFHVLVGGFNEKISLGEDSWYVKSCIESGAKFMRMPFAFLMDMRRVEEKGSRYMTKTLLKGFFSTFIELEKIGSHNTKTQCIDYDFDIYKK